MDSQNVRIANALPESQQKQYSRKDYENASRAAQHILESTETDNSARAIAVFSNIMVVAGHLADLGRKGIAVEIDEKWNCQNPELVMKCLLDAVVMATRQSVGLLELIEKVKETVLVPLMIMTADLKPDAAPGEPEAPQEPNKEV